ncbi:MAG: PLP-dependent aminotransferase family protein [Lachnospiraceae bacterium]|nr:PLP-dependent aminotransferase family protein [Lachnospiraceae bacterium]
MYEMTIQLQTDSKVRLYEQIYRHIKQEIIEGKLLAGERLPSTRSLADYLQVARSTVDEAYGQLCDEGYIEACPYRGYFVCAVEEWLQAPMQDVDERVENAVRRPQGVGDNGRGASDTFRDEIYESDTRTRSWQVDFSPYAIDMSAFPMSVWKKLSRKVLTEAEVDLFAKGDARGDLGLRRSISRYIHSARGVECTPDQVIVGAGNEYLLMLLEKILGGNLRIAMENPTYERSYRIFHSFEYEVVTVPMDDSGMIVEELKKTKADVAYVMPSHQFPTGTVMPIGRRMELLNWANGAEGRYLIEDDYDSEFRYRGKPIPALQASDKQGKVIYIGTFSKAIAPAIRVSFMVLPPVLLEKYHRECGFYSCTVSRIDQRILEEFIRDGYFERHLNKMRKIYRAKHDLLMDSLKTMRKSFDISGENAGLHLLLTSKTEREEKWLREAAAAVGVKVYGLSDSVVDGEDIPHNGTVLLGFGGLDEAAIRQGVELLKQAWYK